MLNQDTRQYVPKSLIAQDRYKDALTEPCSTAPTKSVISEKFEYLAKTIAENKELLLQLQSRLQIVLSPSPAPTNQVPCETSSPILMVAELENLCGALESNNQMIRNILQNLGL